MTKRQMELELARLMAENKALAENKAKTSKSKATKKQFAWTRCDETTKRAGGIEYGYIEFVGCSSAADFSAEQSAAKTAIKAARWGQYGKGKFHYVPGKGWKGPKAEATKIVKF